ncbi:hypothetical protein HJG60_010187 [Phyllostomus discolor]|uniref:Ricin B lectin domain-containing protein n=1 Tax=Phyllostomus discolor TaxID=89673 RepID=A0A834AXV4_9CHIR|nr:hypothetical protein HJG60_010187 [Phyllostomus discolor]
MELNRSREEERRRRYGSGGKWEEIQQKCHTSPKKIRVKSRWCDDNDTTFMWQYHVLGTQSPQQTYKNSGIDYGDFFSRMALWEKLKCKTFDWYLKNVYPALKPIHNIVGYGRQCFQMRNLLDGHICLDQGPIPGNTPIMCYCNEYSPQNVYHYLTGELYMGQLIAKTDVDDCCLTDPGSGKKPTLEPCSKAPSNRLHIYWDFKPSGRG